MFALGGGLVRPRRSGIPSGRREEEQHGLYIENLYFINFTTLMKLFKVGN